jgi:hypothetical protein
MQTQMCTTQAPDAAAQSRVQTSMWSAPVQGIRMPFPASRLRTVDGLSYVTGMTTANAANGATAGVINGATKDAQGDEAFEDPV